MRCWVLSLAFVVPLAGTAAAQIQGGVQQSGQATAGDCAYFTQNQIIADTGFACSGGGGGIVTLIIGNSGILPVGPSNGAVTLSLGAITPTSVAVNGASLVGSAKFAVATGATGSVELGQWSAASTYNALSLNGSLTDGSMNGFVGKSGDNSLYLLAAGSTILRYGGVTSTQWIFNTGALSLAAGEGGNFNSSVNGGVLYGRGSTYDAALANQSGTVALGIVTGTTNVQVASLLQFGGATSSFPALKRVGSTQWVAARLADDSGFAPLQGVLTTDTAYTAGTTVATGYIVIHDSTGTAYKVNACTGC